MHEDKDRRAYRLERMRAIEEADDAATVARLEALGVDRGWRCLEVAAGAGSIARWLAERVGESGHVVATELEPSLLRAAELSGVEVRAHDVVRDELESAAFDLVHVRHLLANLPGRVPALRRILEALKPGGWVLIEEVDFVTCRADPASPPPLRDLYTRVLAELLRFCRLQGADPDFGGRVHGLLRVHGFEEVEAEGTTRTFRGDPTAVTLQQLNFRDFRSQLVSDGRVGGQEFDDFLALYDDPAFAYRDALRVATMGRRPVNL